MAFKQFLTSKGTNAAKLSAAIDVSPGTVSKWGSGSTKPSKDKLIMAANYLGMEPSQFENELTNLGKYAAIDISTFVNPKNSNTIDAEQDAKYVSRSLALPYIPISKRTVLYHMASSASSALLHEAFNLIPLPADQATSFGEGAVVFEVGNDLMGQTLPIGCNATSTFVPEREWPSLKSGVVALAIHDKIVFKRLVQNTLVDNDYLETYTDHGNVRVLIPRIDIKAIWLVRKRWYPSEDVL